MYDHIENGDVDNAVKGWIAASPTLLALIVDRWGWRSAQVVLVVCAAASWPAMELMSR